MVDGQQKKGTEFSKVKTKRVTKQLEKFMEAKRQTGMNCRFVIVLFSVHFISNLLTNKYIRYYCD